LRYCPSCFNEDLEVLGESYWRRSHQIVGSLYCSKHKVLLKNSSVASTSSGLDYVCADSDVCNGEVDPDPYPIKIKELNLAYVRNAEFLMKGDYQRKDSSFIIGFYIDSLRKRGLTAESGNLNQKEVQTSFLD